MIGSKETDTQLSRRKSLRAAGITAGPFLLDRVNNTLSDKNMLSDGRWNYTWDAENRLTSMTVNTNVGPQLQLDFQYDWMGRRISKTVKTNGVTSYSRKFLYDGWNLIAELDGNNALVRSYTWGLDASGSMQRAGGVGGLLMVNAGSGGVHFPAYDLNGNVMGLVNATNGMISAKYEYGPFGEVFCSVGDMAKVNPFQFSTKYTDTETDLLYYGYRYYSPSLGRWLSRDPIEEQGGLNLYGFVNNDPVNRWDRLGMWSHSHDCAEDQLELLRNTEEGAKKCLAEWSKFFKSLDNFNYENFFMVKNSKI